MDSLRRASKTLSIAALLFTLAASALVVMAYSYAKESPGTTELVARVTADVEAWTQLRESVRTSVQDALAGGESAEARYVAGAQALTQHIANVRQLVRSSSTARAFLDAQASTYDLLRTERAALSALPGDPAHARTLMSAESYLAAEQKLAKDLHEFISAVHDLRQSRLRAFLTLAITILTFVTGGVIWMFGWAAANRSQQSRRELEEQAHALRVSERKYRNMIEHAAIGVMRVAPDGTILSANATLLQCLGYTAATELVGQNMRTLYADPDEWARVLRVLDAQPFVQGVQLSWKRKDAAGVFVRVTSRVERNEAGEVDVFEHLVEDVTDRVALGEQLRQSQKMEAIGRLAGGVAHDFNNLLTVIAGNAELLAEDESLSPSGSECVDQILSATKSATAVTRGLLVFSRKGTPQPQAVSINDTIGRVQKLIGRLLGEDVHVAAALDSDAGSVFVDPTHLEQAVLNLVVNARDAMPKGGRLTFRTRRTNDRVAIAVTDTGCGMDEATKARAFDPFFTTKAAGKGTGLGLSMVYGFVHQAGGRVEIQSTIGHGTTVTITLPISTGREDVASYPAPAEAWPSGSESVLVIEDQEPLRKLVADVLRRSGYDVITAANTLEARRVMESGKNIDLVLSDVVMPDESGIDFAAWARVTWPHLRVSFMSGFADHPAMRELVSDHFLQKPFAPKALLAHVRTALDRSESSPTSVH
jgi:two-component system cell cycle sensor histidine kinase/response regulator CckA